MRSFDVLVYFITIYSITWIFLIVGIILTRNKNHFTLKMKKLFEDQRVKKFKYPPFKTLLNLWIKNLYLPAVLTFIYIIIVPAAIMYFILGLTLISPALAAVQGFTVGIFIAGFDKRSMLWAAASSVFEFGYWALSGALGLFAAINLITSDISLPDSLFQTFDLLLSDCLIPLIIFMAGNAFIVIAGPVYWNVNTGISLEDLKKGAAPE